MSKLIQAHLLGGSADGQMVAVDHALEYVNYAPKVRATNQRGSVDGHIRLGVGYEEYRRYFEIDEDNVVFLHSMLGEYEAKVLLCRRYFEVPWS